MLNLTNSCFEKRKAFEKTFLTAFFIELAIILYVFSEGKKGELYMKNMTVDSLKGLARIARIFFFIQC